MDALASVGELEQHLGRQLPDQGAAELALTLASGAVRAYCGWNLTRESTEFEVDGDGTQVLSLPTLHLVAVDTVTVDGVAVVPGDRSLYPLWSRKGQLYRVSGWAKHCVVHASVVHGYDPVPDLLRLVALDLAARQVTNPEGLVSATTGPVSRTWSSGSGSEPGAMSALHTRLLDTYTL